ncbi:uncharacterized protein [Eurosta solidaginis]|uniref:uncharacterized protein n=1 Tax=Eurosta solidaginis TaxID=178769 RepID=UPI0035306654
MQFARQRENLRRKFDCEFDDTSYVDDNNREVKSLKQTMKHGETTNMYARYEIMFTNEPELERFAFRKELTERERKPLGFSSSDSLETSFDNITRMAGGANNPAERRVTNVVTAPSECKSKPPGLYCFKPNPKVNIIETKLSKTAIKKSTERDQFNYCKYFDESKAIKRKTRGTQSLYRESSTQTLPYLPEVSNEQSELEQMEIFKLPTILPGDGPPGIYQVEVLERARKRWAFARALKENLRRQIEEVKTKIQLPEHSIILQAFEWEHWIEREEYIQECQMLRLELLIGMFNKREKKMHTTSKSRIEQSYVRILERRDASLLKNQVEFERGMRQLEIKRRRVPKCWRKENILSQMASASSEFYGPQLRYGVNPARRHFVGGRKEFNERMDDLEKRAVNFDKLVCPFTKLKQWSKPKGRFLEIEQNFCSDENLQKIYETLTILRKQAVKQKIVPKCLIKKTKQTPGVPRDTSPPQKPKASVIVTTTVTETADDGTTSEELKRLQDEKFRKSVEAKKLRAQILLQESFDETIEAMVQEYEGSTIGWLMRFLSEEMGRLQEQRLLQYISMLAQKERWRREAAEAGLRQKENEMRQIYEQIYSESYVAGTEICRNYLNMILHNDIWNLAHESAENEALDMARVIDADIQRWLDTFYDIQNPLNYHQLRSNLMKTIFPDINDILKEIETKLTIKYIIEDVLFSAVNELLEPIDIGTFTATELIDRLFDLDLYYFSSEANSTCSCLACECDEGEREIRAILRKVIRQAVPGRRWKTRSERVAKEMVIDLISDVVNQTLARGSIFSSHSMNRFCLLSKSPSHLNLFIPSSHDMKSTSSETSNEDVLSMKKSELPCVHYMPSKSENSESSASRQLTHQEDAWEPTEETEENKLPSKALSQIYKELLNFLDSEEEEQKEEDDYIEEHEMSTSRSSQSTESKTCGLRLILEQVLENIGVENAGLLAVERQSTQSDILTKEEKLAKFYERCGPLELICDRSDEKSSEQSEELRYIEEILGPQAEQELLQQQQQISKTVIHADSTSKTIEVEDEQEKIMHHEHKLLYDEDEQDRISKKSLTSIRSVRISEIDETFEIKESSEIYILEEHEQ